ncbi:uncharacterized protein LOC105801014 [Gossypium raimondii]|uniref:uncharacterized protein LOC105801014 n=1 Tax=Gossypium raimondii TaxID=29730 RepID=UPI00063AA3AE|nr:uncharacterized protein LOC105801014 [Gossypium raimondii]
MAVYEILHSMKNKNFDKKGSFALKLDISKAYDRVEWRFIKEMLLKMGFSINWMEWIMRFITPVTYSVVVNNRVGDKFTPSQSLRKEDPLSLYPFLVCGESLSALLRLAKSSGTIKGTRVVKGTSRVTHLLFTDDSLISGNVTAIGASNVLKVLQSYAKCSCQLVNFEKSRVFFCSNVAMGNRLDVERILGVHHVDNWEKYLGLPCMVGQKKKWAFVSLRDKIQSRISF